MQNSNIREWSAQVTETAYYWVVELKVFEAGEDFTGDLQAVTGRIDTELEFRYQGKHFYVDVTESAS